MRALSVVPAQTINRVARLLMVLVPPILGPPSVDSGVASAATDPTGSEHDQQPSAFAGRQRAQSVVAAGRFVDAVPSFQTLRSDPVVQQRPGHVGSGGPEPVGRDQDQHRRHHRSRGIGTVCETFQTKTHQIR